jgi:hypothetical protein
MKIPEDVSWTNRLIVGGLQRVPLIPPLQGAGD